MSNHSIKNIILCSDGTGNSPEKGRGTNVWKMFLAVNQHDHESDPALAPQLAFYDNGVGTSSVKLKQVIGSALGVGLGRNIRQLYTSLAKNYKPEDRIYLFGFSRGAFTVRSLAGMIDAVGVIDGRDLSVENLKELVAVAYRAYRSRSGSTRDNFEQLCATQEVGVHRGGIHFVGVWDTVGAVGVPFDWPRVLLQKAALRRRPHAVDLNDSIKNAFHAVAIDEERRSFKVEMFNETKGKDSKTVEQVWFAGVHSSVGGGYPKKGLENVTLHWMMTKAKACDLRLKQQACDEACAGANVHSHLYDSRKGLASYYRYRPRNVADYCARGHTRAKVHVTAIDRIERATDNYAPVNLPPSFEVVGTDPNNSYETQRAKALGGVVSASASLRGGKIGTAQRLSVSRELLYFVFLGVSLFLVAILGVYELDRVTAGEIAEAKTGLECLKNIACVADFAVAKVEGLSDGLSPVLGWIRSTPEGVTKGLQGVVKLGLPDMVAVPLLALFNVPELTLLIAILGLGMFTLRKYLVRSTRDLGVNMWGESFGSAITSVKTAASQSQAKTEKGDSGQAG